MELYANKEIRKVHQHKTTSEKNASKTIHDKTRRQTTLLHSTITFIKFLSTQHNFQEVDFTV
jgi:hypothetical protein